MKNLIIASTSTVYGSDYLEYLRPEVSKLFQNSNEIVFVPYAQPSGMSFDDYSALAKKHLIK